MASSKTLAGIQALRFFAAFGVFVHHAFANASLAALVPTGSAEASRWASSGVIMFFVLSGFLMAKISDQSPSPAKFLFDRALRIYPGLLIATGVIAAAHYGLWGTNIIPGAWLSHFSLAPVGARSTPLGVEWTLVFEVFFYCVVALLVTIPSITLRKMIVASWGLLIVVFGVPASLDVDLAGASMSYLNISFVIGMFTWWAFDRIRLRGYYGVVIASCVFCAGTFAIKEPWLVGFILQCIAFSMLIVIAARSQIFDDHRVLPRLGDASYGIYLVHSPLLAILFATVAQSGWGWFYAISGAALALSTLFGLLEFALHQRLKSAIRLIRPLKTVQP